MCEEWRLARWPNCIPTGGVAQGGLLMPVSSSEVGVAGGGVEPNKWKWVGHVQKRTVEHDLRMDDFREGAQVQHFPILG